MIVDNPEKQLLIFLGAIDLAGCLDFFMEGHRFGMRVPVNVHNSALCVITCPCKLGLIVRVLPLIINTQYQVLVFWECKRLVIEKVLTAYGVSRINIDVSL